MQYSIQYLTGHYTFIQYSVRDILGPSTLYSIVYSTSQGHVLYTVWYTVNLRTLYFIQYNIQYITGQCYSTLYSMVYGTSQDPVLYTVQYTVHHRALYLIQYSVEHSMSTVLNYILGHHTLNSRVHCSRCTALQEMNGTKRREQEVSRIDRACGRTCT